MRSVPSSLPVNGESDALGEEGHLRGLLAALQFIGRKTGQEFSERAIVRAQVSVRLAHFIEGLVERIVSEEAFEFHLGTCAHALAWTSLWAFRAAAKPLPRTGIGSPHRSRTGHEARSACTLLFSL